MNIVDVAISELLLCVFLLLVAHRAILATIVLQLFPGLQLSEYVL